MLDFKFCVLIYILLKTTHFKHGSYIMIITYFSYLFTLRKSVFSMLLFFFPRLMIVVDYHRIQNYVSSFFYCELYKKSRIHNNTCTNVEIANVSEDEYIVLYIKHKLKTYSLYSNCYVHTSIQKASLVAKFKNTHLFNHLLYIYNQKHNQHTFK